MNSENNTLLLLAVLALSLGTAMAKDIDPSAMETDAQAIYNKIATGLNIGAIPVGLLLAFFGYKYKRTTFATMGFVAVGVFTFLAVDTMVDATAAAHAWAPITGFVVAGILGGLLCALLMNVGVFAVGASLGLVLAMVLQTAVLHRVQTNPQNLLLYITMGVLGLVFGGLALKLRRPLLIVATSYVGVFLTVFGIGHFTGGMPSPFDLASAIDGAAKAGTSSVPTLWWVYLGCIAVFGTAAVLVQHLVTGKDKPQGAVVSEYYTMEAGTQFNEASEKQFIEAGPHKAIHGNTLAYN